MIIKQFFDSDIAHSSYLLGDRNNCVVIDPRRDIDIYIKEAKENNLKISHIFLTHLHADFVSGHLDLNDKTGAQIYGPEKAEFAFGHNSLKEGDKIDVESLSFRVIETPGHSPEMINYIAYDNSVNNSTPFGVFTGDTIFIQDVGRPDIFEERFDELSEKLFNSIQEKIVKLPDYCRLFPAHGPGSFCGKAIGSTKTGTIGYERINNKFLTIKGIEEFKEEIKRNMPPAPDHYRRLSDVNRKGPALLKNLETLMPLNTAGLKKAIENRNKIIIDSRGYDSFAAQHIAKSYNIKLIGSFSSYAGWVLPPDAEIIIITESSGDAYHAFNVLRRMGFDENIYYFQDGVQAWVRSGNPVSSFNLIHPSKVDKFIEKEKDIQIADVRNSFEYKKDKIKGSINIPVHELRDRYNELDSNKKTLVYCASGLRGSLASSILLMHGFKDIYNLAGGYAGYSQTKE
ncbi:MAG: rhodanese-like domain-containing protein [Candidatus Humimicrobiaceae bacterium]